MTSPTACGTLNLKKEQKEGFYMSEQTPYLWKDKKHHLWFPLSFTTYYIEDERLMIKEGFLSTTLEEIRPCE